MGANWHGRPARGSRTNDSSRSPRAHLTGAELEAAIAKSPADVGLFWQMAKAPMAMGEAAVRIEIGAGAKLRKVELLEPSAGAAFRKCIEQ